MRGDNNTAVLYMMGAALSYSLIPLWVSINHGYQNPLVFSSFWRLGALATYLVILTILYRPLLNPRDLLVAARLLTAPRHSILILIAAVGTMDYAMFALSTRHIDVAITSVIFEIWPITAMLILARLYGRKVPGRTYAMAPLCFAGFTMVAASQEGGFTGLLNAGATSPLTLFLGFTPAIASLILASLGVCSLKAGSLVAQDHHLNRIAKYHGVTRPLDRYASLLIFVTVNLISIPASITISFFHQGPQDFISQFQQSWPGVMSIVPGGIFLAAGAVLWQAANAKTQNVGINSISYLVPILVLLWLWTFNQVGNVETRYLLTGAAIIVAGNVWINWGKAKVNHTQHTLRTITKPPPTSFPSH